MKIYKRVGWLIIMSGWIPMVLAAQGQGSPVSAVQAAASETKKVSANPEQDYQEGLKFSKIGEAGDLSAFMAAAEHFKLAADAGHAGAQAHYALSLERGQSHEEAIKYYRLSADQGNKDGQFGIGSVYLAGEGVTQDLAEARKWLILAAEQGHKVASITMAEGYLRPEMPADELEKLEKTNPKKVQNYIRSGLGLDEAARKSPEALVWIQRAADNDFLPALDALAIAHRTGQLGLTADTQKADAVVAKADKLRGITPKVEQKKSALYRLLRGDDSDKDAKNPK